MPSSDTRAGLAIITGASAGIGAALARRLSRAGRPVLAVARREGRLRALADEAAAAGTGAAPVHPLVLDVASDGAPERIAAAARALGGAAWLVNDAGFGAYGPFEKQDGAMLARLVRVNCEALVAITHAILPQLRASGDGVLLNVASAAAFQPTPYMSVYGASKAFVLSFTEGLAEELRDAGVFAGAYCPGPVATEFGAISGTDRRFRSPPARLSADDAAAEALAQIARRQVVHVPTLLYRLVTSTGAFFPRSLVRWLAARAQAPEDGR
jgi:short-subunit dehydrogenase